MRADPVFVPIAIALAAVALGLGFGLAPPRLQRVVGPLRTFALTAALAVAGTHLLPEAFSELGPSGVAVFALGLAFPSLTRLTRSFLSPRDRAGSDGALEFGYLGLLVHHVADGMGLGAYGGATGHVDFDVLLALAVHTVPLVAVVTLAYRAQSGVRAACLRSAGLALASVAGVVASASVSQEASHHFSAWVAAGVAGLLVHVVTHDLERDLPTGTASRLLDLAAAISGVVVTVGASALGHEHGDVHETLDVASGVRRLAEITSYLATPVLIGLGAAAAFELAFRDQVRSSLSPLSLARALRLREEPRLASGRGFKSGFLALLLASAVGLDALAVGVWLAGVGLEFVRVFLVVMLAIVAATLFRGGRAERVELEPDTSKSWFRVFADLVARTTPWLVTSVVLAAMLDAALEPNSLAAAASPLIMALIAIALALPVQVDAVAAAPVLAVLVSKGMPASVAVAAWVVVSAPGERALLAVAREHRNLSVLVALIASAGIGFVSLLVVSALPLTWSPPRLPPTLERVGQLAALVLAIPVTVAIWKDGLRGWLSPVFLHDHEHGHHHDHDHRH
jgi:hypothetical protein